MANIKEEESDVEVSEPEHSFDELSKAYDQLFTDSHISLPNMLF